MQRSILVPLDGSTFSAQVIPYAVSAARALNADIDFVQAYVPSYPGPWLNGVAEADLRWERETKAQELEYLTSTANSVAHEYGVATRAHLFDGEVVSGLLQHVRDKHITLVAMATHGRGGVSRAWLGSVADRLVHRCPVPILLFHPRQDSTWQGDAEPFEKILIPLDGSPLAETILPFALELGGPRATYTLMRVLASVDALTVSPPMLALLRDPADSAEDQRALEYLDTMAAGLDARGCNAHVFVRAHPQPATAILEHAYESGADLIAISTHGRHGLSRIALGSIADKVLRSFQKPVLIYRPPAGVPQRRTSAAAFSAA